MKIFYFVYDDFYGVAYGNNKTEAFEKMKRERKELFGKLYLPGNIDYWEVEEFTPDLYDGVLCFY